MIDRIGEFRVPLKGVDQKHPAVLVERAGDPDGDAQTDRQRLSMRKQCTLHFLLLNAFNIEHVQLQTSQDSASCQEKYEPVQNLCQKSIARQNSEARKPLDSVPHRWTDSP
jgi:hypothetical protein